MNNKQKYPIYIYCKNIAERDAAAQFLISHGVLVHGREDHLNGDYKKCFEDDMNTIIVKNSKRFLGSVYVVNQAKRFYDIADDLHEFFTKQKEEEEEEFQPNDWVVFGHNKLFQVKEKMNSGLYKLYGVDSEFETRVLRHATDEEIEEHLRYQLPDFIKNGNWKFNGNDEKDLSTPKRIDEIKYVNDTENRMSHLCHECFKEYGTFLVLYCGFQSYPFHPRAKQYFVEKSSLPVINGYHGEFYGDYVKYGCAEIDMEIIYFLYNQDFVGNRKVSSVKLDSGVEITAKDAQQIMEAYR